MHAGTVIMRSFQAQRLRDLSRLLSPDTWSKPGGDLVLRVWSECEIDRRNR